MNADNIHTRLSALQNIALAIGVIGLALGVAGAFSNARQFFISYLVAFLFWLGLALGCLGFLMVYYLTGGRWGFPMRRFYEAAAMTLPLMAVLFIPVCIGMHELYQWTDPHAVAADEAMRHRAAYMNPAGFIIRGAVFLVAWSIVSWLLNRWSFQDDASRDAGPMRRMRTLSGPGITLYPVTATFVLVDWVLSLEPDWFSTMFLVLIVVSQMLSAIAFGIILLAWLRDVAPFSEKDTVTQFHHLGMLLLAFVMLWTYMAFGEFLIIYSGNQPHEIVWYLHRIAGDWKVVVWFMFLFHFLLPFFLLLSRNIKRNAVFLAGIAATVLIAHFVNTYWLVVPAFDKTGIRLHWLDAAAIAGVGGLWLFVFAARLKSRPLLALNLREDGHV